MNYNFNAKETTENIIQWIKNWFEKNGKDCNAVIGLSGGKDSTILCALLVQALGKNRVIAVAMPGIGQDLHNADKIAEYFGVRFEIKSIAPMEQCYLDASTWTKQARYNIPPKLRMTMLYAVSQSNNGRVIGTTNCDERLLGYFTKFGDGLASDCEPMEMLTVNELHAIGEYLQIPHEWLYKTPSADLPNVSTDEEEYGFTYEEFGNYIRGIHTPSTEIKKKMDERMKVNAFKLKPIEHFIPSLK